jgi:hypothetical protein
MRPLDRVHAASGKSGRGVCARKANDGIVVPEEAAFGRDRFERRRFQESAPRARRFQPIHIFEGNSGKPILSLLRPGKRPSGEEIARVLWHVIRRIRRRVRLLRPRGDRPSSIALSDKLHSGSASPWLLRPRGDRPGFGYFSRGVNSAPPPARRSTLDARLADLIDQGSSARAEIDPCRT